MNTQLPEEVRVGTFNALTQRWATRGVKRKVLEKKMAERLSGRARRLMRGSMGKGEQNGR